MDIIKQGSVTTSPDLKTESLGTPAEIAKQNQDIDPNYSRKVINLGLIEVVLEPGRVRNWRHFTEHAEPGSVALDGYVSGATKRQRRGPYANFNHHEDVDRFSTHSTCMQVFEAIKFGFVDQFKVNGQVKMRVYVNDCDEDTCLSLWLLAHYDKFVGTNTNDLMEKLALFEDRLDRSAGAFPFHMDDRMLGKIAWVFEPYRDNRPKLQGMNAAEVAAIIQAVCLRISCYAEGEGLWIQPQAGYRRLQDVIKLSGEPQGWIFITEEQTYARIKLIADHDGFVSLVSETKNMFRYSIGRLKSQGIFPVEELYEVLNIAEKLKGNKITENNRWGGAPNIGGSPRSTSSILTPQELMELVNKFLKFYEAEIFSDQRKQMFLEEILPVHFGIVH